MPEQKARNQPLDTCKTKEKPMVDDHGRRGVVTGASSGSGELFAPRLAGRRMSLVLTGRDQSRTDDVAERD